MNWFTSKAYFIYGAAESKRLKFSYCCAAPSDFSAGSYNRSSSKVRLSGSYGSTGTATNGPIGTSNFTFEEINKATMKFSPANKVGEGGFGTVYKGELENGTLVAVKRAKKVILSFDELHCT